MQLTPSKSTPDQRAQLRVEASAGDLPKGCLLIPTGVGTFNVYLIDLSEADAATVIRAVKAALQR